MDFPENEFNACRGISGRDNRRRMDAWVVLRGAVGFGPDNLSLIKGKKAHLIVLQNGNMSTAPSGRFRTGFWEGGRQHFASLTMQIDDKHSDAMFRKYVRRPHYTYREYDNVERIDFVQFDIPGLCIAVKSDGSHDVIFRLQASHATMWPVEETAENYELVRDGSSYIVKSSLSSTRLAARGKDAGVTFDGRNVTVTFPQCTEAILFVCDGSSTEGDFDLKKQAGYHSRISEMCVLKTPDFMFNKAFFWAKHDLLEFYSETEIGNGFYAGFPEFSWFFGRDGEWMSMAAAECGLHEFAREHLRTLHLASRDGRMPHELPLIEDSGNNGTYKLGGHELETKYMSIDSTPLWVLAELNISRWTGIPPPLSDIRSAIEFCKSCDRDGDGLMENRFSEGLIGWPESWADRRDGTCIDVNAWWLEALKEYSVMTGSDVELLRKTMSSFSSVFFQGDDNQFEVIDSQKDGKLRLIKNAMEIVPAMYGRGRRYEKLVRFLSGEDMLVRWGIRSMSSLDPMYDRGYHTGQVWPLMTGWFVLAAYNNDMPDIGFSALRSFPMLSFSSPDPGRINEVYHSEYVQATGQFAQGWSSSLFVQCIVEALFGLKPDGNSGKEGLSSCRPRLPEGWKSMEMLNVEYQGLHFDIRVKPDGFSITQR